jgi:metal-sulfur cluster biosynthetic enzyme
VEDSAGKATPGFVLLPDHPEPGVVTPPDQPEPGLELPGAGTRGPSGFEGCEGRETETALTIIAREIHFCKEFIEGSSYKKLIFTPLYCIFIERTGSMIEESFQRKVDRVLSKVRDPESLLPVKDLGWVTHVRYLNALDKLEVETDINPPRFTCALCGIITAGLRDTVHRLLEEEFRKEFPGTNVVVFQRSVEEG